jgi:D-alanyl-D-alanine carboxypeptidase
MVIRRAILVLAVAVTLVAISAASASAGTRKADAALDQALETLVQMPDGPPGVSVVVQRGGDREIHGAGRANVLVPGGIGLRDHQRIASVTKAFTGAVVLRLVARKTLSLGDTVGELRPELPASWHPITIRQLLYHTSGLPNYTATPAFQAYFPTHLKDYTSPEQIVAFAATEPVEFPPGSRYEYSNTDNIVLGLMAESAARRSIETLYRRHIFKPLKLTDTSFPLHTLALPAPFVHGYVFDGPGLPHADVTEEVSPSGTWAAGAIVSSMRDMNRFIRAWASGRLIGSKKVRRAQINFLPPFSGGEPPGPGQNRGGLTIYRYASSCGTVFGHSGNFPGFTQFIAASPNGRRSTVVSTNLQLNIGTGPPHVFVPLHEVFNRAACAALAK